MGMIPMSLNAQYMKSAQHCHCERSVAISPWQDDVKQRKMCCIKIVTSQNKMQVLLFLHHYLVLKK